LSALTGYALAKFPVPWPLDAVQTCLLAGVLVPPVSAGAAAVTCLLAKFRAGPNTYWSVLLAFRAVPVRDLPGADLTRLSAVPDEGHRVGAGGRLPGSHPVRADRGAE